MEFTKKYNKYKTRGAYHWWWYRNNRHLYRDYAHKTLSYFPDKGTLIDIGCGDGLLSFLFFQKGFKVVGIDSDFTGVNLGQKQIIKHYFPKHPIEFILGIIGGGPINYLAKQGIELRNISAYDLNDELLFDYAICMEVIEHVPEPSKLIEKIMSITRKYSILSTPNGEWCAPEVEDYQFWTPTEFIAMIGKHKSEILHVDRNRIFVKLIKE